jgi:predicted enzyme related to lactoylglutathione lyase
MGIPMGERTRYEPGTFCWVGLATSDPGGATAFYTSLFGWQAEDLPAGAAGTFTLLRQDGSDVAILYRQTTEALAAGAPPHWTSYISVEDADATAARADELGGAAVFREPFDVLDAGRVVAIRDPTGAIVSLWQPRSRIGATLVNDVGAFCWNELATDDVERAASFFAALLGWD